MISLIIINLAYIIPFFIIFILLYIYIYIFFLNFSNIIVDFSIDTLKRKVYRIFLTCLLLLMFLSILVWRIIRCNRFIFIDKEYLYSIFLDTLEIFELTFISLIFLILLSILIILLWIGIFGTFMIYIKGIAYTVHVYFYQYKLYNKFFTKNLMFKANMHQFFIRTFILNLKDNNPLQDIFMYILKISTKIKKILFIFFVLLPFIFLIFDLYMYSCIHRFFYCLPWVYIIILIRMFFKLISITYGPTEDKAGNMRSLFLYKHKRYYSIYKLNCKTLEVTNK